MRKYLYIVLAVLLFGLGAYVDRLYMRGVVQQETNKLDKVIKERDADLRLAEKRSDNLTLHYQELLNESSKLAKAEAAKAKADLLVSINVANGLRRDITALNASVTEDITGAVADSINYTVEELRSLVRGRSTQPTLVGQIMSQPVQTAQTGQLVMELVPLFSQGGHHHIPILDDRQRLMGIVTQTDLVRALAGALQVPQA